MNDNTGNIERRKSGDSDRRGKKSNEKDQQKSPPDIAAGKFHWGSSSKGHVDKETQAFEEEHKRYKEFIDDMELGRQQLYEDRLAGIEDRLQKCQADTKKNRLPFTGKDKKAEAKEILNDFAKMTDNMESEALDQRIAELQPAIRSVMMQIQDALKSYTGKDARVLGRFFRYEIKEYLKKPSVDVLVTLKRFSAEKLHKRINEEASEASDRSNEQVSDA